MAWLEWCRLCGKDEGNQFDIFIKKENNTNLCETIQKHFSVMIDPDDSIPTKICLHCHQFLFTMIHFADQTNKVQQMFIELDSLSKLESNLDLYSVRKKHGIEKVIKIKSNDGNRNIGRYAYDITKEENSLGTNQEDCGDVTHLNTDETYESKLYEIKNEFEDENSNDFVDSFESENDDASEIINSSNLEKSSQNIDLNSSYPAEYVQCNNEKSISNQIGEIKNVGNKKTRKPSEIPKYRKKKYKDEEKRNQCEICLMKFVRENNLSAHLKKAHKIVKELPPCEFCGKICKTKQKLKFHRELHLPSEERQKLLFQCPSCDQKFTQKGAMRSHIRGTHSNERPFICEACGKAFTSQSNLWAHRKKTHEEERMPCKICNKIWKNSASLRRHMNTHKEPLLPCSVCGVMLKTNKTLKNHMLVHSDIKAYQCNYCNKEFKRDITLQLHMIIHSGLKPYVCRFCEQTYANPSNCKKHEKHSHPTEYNAAASKNRQAHPQRVMRKLPNIKQLKAMLEDMKAAKDNKS